MQRDEVWDEHDKFKELCALAQCGSLNADEQAALDRHLQICGSCREIREEYFVIGEKGMATLLAEKELLEEARNWDSRASGERLLASIQKQSLPRVLPIHATQTRRTSERSPSIFRRVLAIACLAACVLVVITMGAYRLGKRNGVFVPQRAANSSLKKQDIEAENRPSLGPSVDLAATQAAQIASMERQIAAEQEEVSRLRAASIIAEQQIQGLGSATDRKDANLAQLTSERDQLANRLSESERAYETLQADYSSLRAEHSRSLVHTTSLESEVNDLRTVNQDQERRLKDSDKYLEADRDIRELMGARKLYIADVFDVDSRSRTRKPFGRVFYTQSKSLVFYAYDLDHQPGVQNASVFQVWGQRDGETNGATIPLNLGILYMDSESNRRWVLRSDDPKQLAEIDAVFVTVEPHGGSQKPTGKPLLYALLRKEVNHP
jgi:anti-sigma-K factor RskA